MSALAATIAGLPSRPSILIWLVGVIALATWRNPNRVAPRVFWDWLPILVIAAGYDLVRSRAPDLLTRATTEPQLRFDEIVFGGTAPTVVLQNALVDRSTPHWWDYPAWLMYLSHFVFTLWISLWLYLRHHEWFHRYTILILTVSVCGFITYFIVPAVPPWLASRKCELELPHASSTRSGPSSDQGAAEDLRGNAKRANPVSGASLVAHRLAVHDLALPLRRSGGGAAASSRTTLR